MQERDGDSIPGSGIGSGPNLIRMVFMLVDIALLRAIAWVLRAKGWVWKGFRFSHRVLFLAGARLFVSIEILSSLCLDKVCVCVEWSDALRF
jgi:hypothetical protein